MRDSLAKYYTNKPTIYLGTFVYNNPCIYRFKRAFEYLASNQVVGSSKLSGRAIKSRSYGALKKCTVP